MTLRHSQVLDENDNNPVFAEGPTEFHVSEDSAIGTVVAHLTATDADAGEHGRITYALDPTGTHGKFKIDKDTVSKSSGSGFSEPFFGRAQHRIFDHFPSTRIADESSSFHLRIFLDFEFLSVFISSADLQGVITVAASLDREDISQFTLIVQAWDNYEAGVGTDQSRRSFKQVGLGKFEE